MTQQEPERRFLLERLRGLEKKSKLLSIFSLRKRL
jgi:hypothetical protein